jgi:hypothetical protein
VPKTCVAGSPVTESCDGKDNDCNGAVDDAIPALTCGVGACFNSVPACVGGITQTCIPKATSPETCDGKDNDCNGAIDDGLANLTCGVGECFNSVVACIGGVTQTCTPKATSPETCDGKDNDCNGVKDDGLANLTCGVGECFNSVVACVGGVPQTCTPKPTSAETCDGKDNDCNGTADDGTASSMCPPVTGTHVTTTTCTAEPACRVSLCNSTYYDINKTFSDGCECLETTSTPHLCGSALDVGTVAVGASKVFTSTSPLVGREDWVKITFLDVRTNKLSHPKIQLTTNPGGVFQIQVQYASCSGAIPGCGGSGEGSATAKDVFETSYSPSPIGVSTDPAWGPILSPGIIASTNNALMYVRVLQKTGTAATCTPYTITFSN